MARLQRNDLAREFSDVVQQEVKNHNDSILATNIALNEMQKQLDDFKKSLEKSDMKFGAQFIEHGTMVQWIEEKFQSLISQLQRDLNDKAALIRNELISMNQAFKDRESYFMPIDGFDQFKAKIEQWSANIHRAFAVQKDTISQETRRIAEDTRLAIEVVRKAIEKSIAQEIEDRKEQDTTLDHFSVNFEGMKTEIERLKKRSFIIEKNIENLYTQIERLKAAK